MSNLTKQTKDQIVEALIQNSPIAYIVLDDEYRIHFLNDSFLKLRSLTKEGTMGELCYNISNKGVPCDKCAVRTSLQTNKREFIARKDILPNGQVRYIDDYAIPFTVDGTGEHSFVLELMVDRTATMLARAKHHKTLGDILEALIELLESKDTYTAQHSRNVHRYASQLAEKMGLEDTMIEEISIGGLLHDIGKVNIPYEIINKPSALSDDEYALIKQHPPTGDDLLNEFSRFDRIRRHVRQHHERVDGRGYPDQLSGDDLLVGSKILAVADTYDAMTTDRPYRKALTHDEAINELKQVAGAQLDAEIVEKFIEYGIGTCGEAGSENTAKQTSEVTRKLEDQSVKTADLEEARKHLDYKSHINEDKFLQAIFDNTPCGYVLFDKNGLVVFASDYYLKYQDLSEAYIGTTCTDPLIEKTIEKKSVIVESVETTINNEFIAYDVYSIPVSNGNDSIEYVIWCTLDRTEEVAFERSFRDDYLNVIKLIHSLIYVRLDGEENESRITHMETYLSDLAKEHGISDEILFSRT